MHFLRRLAIAFGTSLFTCSLGVVAAQVTPLWIPNVSVPKAADLPVLKNVRFSVIKRYEPDRDGYRFLHGVALCFHGGKLYASFGRNKGGENTSTEEAHFCLSTDDGRTWTVPSPIDTATEGDLGVSHGVFLSSQGRLWAFHGAFTGTMKDVHTRAYVFNEARQTWEPKGRVVNDGFWPLGEPQRMANGNWIMSGIRVGDGNPPAVAISHGDNLLQWDLVVIRLADSLGQVWGESAVVLTGPMVINIARWGEKPQALFAISKDFGRTWTVSQPSNLPMATSKPCAGTLSTGQHYLICSISADGGRQRSPLTIAVTRPGELVFRRIFVIRHAFFPEGPGESHPRAALAYPCAIEHDGKLYVGYSNNGGNVGRVGSGREVWNNNSAELAVIPIEELSAE